MRPGLDAALEAILAAPLHAPSPAWTSRSVAVLLGTSQSAVSRAWAQAYGPGRQPTQERLPMSGLRLDALGLSAAGSLLVLSRDRDGTTGRAPLLPPGPFMRSPRRAPLQAALAADLVATASAAGSVAEVPGGLLAGIDPRRDTYVLTTLAAEAVGADLRRTPDVDVLAVHEPLAWQGLLEPLVRAVTETPQRDLLDLQHRLMEWARGDRAPFAWRPASSRAPASTARTSRLPAPRATSQAVADDVVDLVLRRVAEGRLTGGDRLAESDLARTLRTSRGQVRDALRLLASAGLVELEAGRGAVVPTPTEADVVETYAARRALGTVVVRYAVRVPAEALAPVRAAFDRMLEVAATGDASATGDADLVVQDALAGATRLRQVPQMFQGLTARLRVFIAVMGLDYTYSIPGMCRDDELLLALIANRDERGAVAAWNRKIDDALAYMTTQLARWARHQPRARHSGRAARSRPSVVSSPWPG